jgi:site-specific DNA recombinase
MEDHKFIVTFITPETSELRGDLAGILAISLKTKARATGTSQVEMIAGMGFEPMTFRL